MTITITKRGRIVRNIFTGIGVVALLVGYAFFANSERIAGGDLDNDEPDYTVAQCSLWANDANPTIPDYSYTDRCAYQAADGTWQIHHIK